VIATLYPTYEPDANPAPSKTKAYANIGPVKFIDTKAVIKPPVTPITPDILPILLENLIFFYKKYNNYKIYLAVF
jgi:hypothetical protein